MNINRKSLVKEMKRYARAASELKKVEADIELQVQSVKASYQDKVKKWLHMRALASERLQMVAFYHYDELFSKEKHIGLKYGCMGFKKSKHKVVKEGRTSWEEIYTICEKVAPDFLRIKTELNKNKVLALREQPDVVKQLKQIGISILQDEYFFVHPYDE